MNHKVLNIDFRYLSGNIACLSVDSITGKSVHNDINDDEAIIIFNSLVGEKEDCTTVKSLQQENKQLKEQLDFAKLDIPESNFEHFRMLKENKRKIDNLRCQNKQLIKQLQQREEVIEEAIEKLSFIDDALEKDILNVPLCITKINKVIDILNRYKKRRKDKWD